MSVEFTKYRKPTVAERGLLKVLVEKAELRLPPDWLDSVLVEELNDGGMGSLRLCSPGQEEGGRLFGRRASDHQFKDEDGVEVIASLNVDQSNLPLELDMWKTDFSPLIRIVPIPIGNEDS